MKCPRCNFIIGSKCFRCEKKKATKYIKRFDKVFCKECYKTMICGLDKGEIKWKSKQ